MTDLVGAVLSVAKAFKRLVAPSSELEGLRVAVFGLRSHISRDTVRCLVGRRAAVTVVGQACEVEFLRRDLELLHTQVDLAAIDKVDRSEIELMTDSLRALGKLPHVVVCCCLDGECPLPVVVSVMQPSLALHLAVNLSMGPGPDRPAIPTKTLAALLNDPGLFDPAQALSKVKLGRRLFDVSRRAAIPGDRASRRQPRSADRSAPSSKSAHRPPAPVRQAVRPLQTQSLHQGDQV